jgi:Na+/H+-dicarboxylate symporter/ABC-type amino acid transport substrate-binding protein
MSSSTSVLIGLAAGIVLGLFIGEHAGALHWVADGFIRLLQMTVLPYVTVSIVTSLGRLDYARARTAALRLGIVIGGLWLVALAFAFATPLAFPTVERASFFSTSLVERRPPLDLVALYVPANPFNALAFNIVPAVVLFSFLVGLALIGVERKQVLLDVLQVAAAAIARVTRAVARLTPIGVFAIAATTAGTMQFDQLARLQIYLIIYAAAALLLSLWVLPGLVAALTTIPYRDLLRTAQTPLITAFVAGDLFIVLPALIDASKTLMERHGAAEAAALPDAIVPASYNFPHSAKLLSVSFILFAGWFAETPVPVSRYAELAAASVVSFFGSLNAAVPFLLDLFRIPADTFQLFVATSVINSRFGTLLSAVHTLTVALLGAASMTRLLVWDGRRITRYVMVTAAATVVVIGGARALFATLLQPEYRTDQVLAAMQLRDRAVEAVVHRSMPALPVMAATDVLDGIRARGTLRVGYLPDALPYAFFNQNGDLVGFDVELAYVLAHEIGAELHFVPLSRDDIGSTLDAGLCDLVMSGVTVTTDRATRLFFSTSYLDETLGFIVPDHARDRFVAWPAIAARGPIVIGVPDLPYFVDKLRRLLPDARLHPLRSVDEMAASTPPLEAVAFPAERGAAWTLMHPQYSMVVPEGALVKVPLAYPIARRDERFAAFLNTWIELKRRDGTLERAFEYWILGKHATPATPRWAFARNVLHWIE